MVLGIATLETSAPKLLFETPCDEKELFANGRSKDTNELPVTNIARQKGVDKT